MARFAIEAGELIVRLSPLEKLGALHGDVRAPLFAVGRVATTVDPRDELRGIRMPGTGFPALIMLGTYRGAFGKDFAAVYGTRPAVLVELLGHEFQRLLVSTSDPDAEAAEIAEAAGRPHRA